MELIEGEELKLNYPGLCKEKSKAGTVFYRVRVIGKKGKRIPIKFLPGDKHFDEAYHCARRGIVFNLEQPKSETSLTYSFAWLTYKYEEHLDRQVKHKRMSPKTLKKKKLTLEFLRKGNLKKPALIPQSKIEEIRDLKAGTPAAADYVIETISTMYAWAKKAPETKHVIKINPAIDVERIDQGRGGAKPWTVVEINKFKQRHKPGSTAHMALTLFLFTGCRIGDARTLGRANEVEIEGEIWLDWQPEKKNTARVTIPMMPPLFKAIRGMKVQGTTYLLSAFGHPYNSTSSLGQRFKKWCDQAGLKGYSAHGIRKGLGNILAESGCSELEIMSVLGHSDAKSSRPYTKDARRTKMASSAINKALASLSW